MVKFKAVSVEKAARMFGVPAQTLRDRISGNVDPENCQTGPNTALSYDQEAILVSHVETMAELGYGYSNNKLKHLAGEMAFEMKVKNRNRPMSNNWMYGFLRRWKGRLASIRPRKLDSTRAKSSTPEKVNDYLLKLEDVMKHHELLNKPQYIYNLDETGLQPDHRPPNVIANLNSKCQAITSPRSTTTTLIGCVNALGQSLPPYLIFKGKRFNPELMKGCSVGAKGVMSDSGWSNSVIFQQYLEEHFLPYARPCLTDKQPILLIYDGHTSHKSPQLINWARERGLILFVLPAHTSHLLQPLDVAVFGPFKNYYYSECSNFLSNHIGQVITRCELCSIACKAYTRAMSPSNIQAAFRKTGIFPLNSTIISMERLFPCENFREDRPIQKIRAIKTGTAEAETFIHNKEENLSNNALPCPLRKIHKDPRPDAGGRAITDDEYVTEITHYTQQRAQSLSKTTETSTNLNRSSPCSSQIASTSGLNLNKNIPAVVPSSDSEDEEFSVDEADVCCVCKKFSPPNLRNFPMLKIVNWAQCDVCGHWTHLSICTTVRVVRRHSTFLCPHCYV